MRFMWRLPETNPYLRLETRNTVTSRYKDVAMAVSHHEMEADALKGARMVR